MPKFNIYKIIRNSKNDLISKLINVDLELVGSKMIDNFTLEFYLSTEPDEVSIWWAEYYRSFFEHEELPENKIYFGCLLIYNDDIIYAISLGKTHFYLKEYCDLEFGIKLAERIIDVNNLRLKNSKFYKSKRNKSITSYSNNTELDYDCLFRSKYTRYFGESIPLNLP